MTGESHRGGSSERRRWKVYACPQCGEHVPFSAMDAVHGGSPVCGCTAGVATDESGLSSIQGYAPAEVIEVMPVSDHEAIVEPIRRSVANQRAENRQLIRQLDELRSKEPAEMVKLQKKLERVCGALEQSKHRGKQVEYRLDALYDAIRDGHWKLAAALVPPAGPDPSDQRLHGHPNGWGEL